MIHVQGKNAQAERSRGGQRGMEQRRRVAAAAVGHGDYTLRRGTAVSVRSCR